jgi:predicted metal-dependent peptidase
MSNISPIKSPIDNNPASSEAQNKVSFDLNLHVYRLLSSEPFYASISRRVNKVASTAIPTAGVKIDKESKQFEMLYNPSFFEKLSDLERTDVLRHEFDHLVYDHVTGRLPAEGMTKIWNIATDLAINSHLPNIPKIACIPGEGTFAHLEKGKAAEYYFEELKKQQEKNEEEKSKGGKDEKGEPSDGSGNGNPSDGLPDTFDDHSGWSEQDASMDNTSNEIAKERLKEAIKEAAQNCAKSNNWGSISSEQRKRIMETLETSVDWRKMLRYFVKVSQRCDKSSTVRRINKRFPRIHAGKKVNRVANIAISIDQSGSVSDQMLALFFSELNNLASIATFTVIPFDTRVDDKLVYTWKKGKKNLWERVMCGGTDFNAPTKWVNADSKFDGHIVLTDMCAPKPVSSACPRMWMTDKENARNPYFKTSEIIVAVGK